MPRTLDLIVAGTGRAGASLALASGAAGHRVVGTLNRTPSETYGPALEWSTPLPAADLLIVAVRDDAIADVAERLRGRCELIAAAVHVSGATSVRALDPLASECPTGSFHPLQTLPDPVAGRGGTRRRLGGGDGGR